MIFSSVQTPNPPSPVKTYTACLVATSALLLAICGPTSALADDACGNPRTPTEKPECASGEEEKDDGCPDKKEGDGIKNDCDEGSPNDGAGVNTFNVFTGNLHRTIADIEVWGGVGEIPLRLKRTTTSRYMGGVPTPFAGSGNWRHNWQWYIVYGGLNQAGQEIINVYYPDGRNALFSKESSASAYLTGVSRVKDRIQQTTSTDYNLLFADGSKLYFSKSGSGSSTTFTPHGLNDRHGQWYPFNQDSKGRITRVTEPGGRYLEFQYGPIGHFSIANVVFALSAADVPGATTVAIAGDFNGWSATANMLTLDNGVWKSTLPLQLGSWQYKFVINGNTWIPDPSNPDHVPPGPNNNSVITVALGDQNTDPAGQTPVEFVYESSSATSVSVAGSFNGWSATATPLTKTGNTWKVTLPVGEGTHLYKFVVNGSSWIQDPNNSFRAPDGFGGYNSKLAVGPMDEAILRVQTSDGRGVDYLYTMETSGWTIYGVLAQVDYGDGTSAAYTYTLPYNRNGRPIIESANDPRYPGRAAMVSYGYQNTGVDGFIQQEKTLGGTPLITVTATNDVDRTLTWANGLVENLTYGSLQLLSRSNSVTGARTASYFDNGYGMRSGWKNAANGETTYERTLQFGAVKKTTRPDNTSVTRTFTDEARPFFVATETDELGRTTTYTRDGSGRPTRIDYPDSTYETYTYNSFGQVLAKRLRDGATNSSTYDSAGRRTSSTDGTGATTTYTYDAHDRLATVTDARSNTTSYQYNERGQTTRITHPDSTTRQFTYDAYGNRTGMTDEAGKTWTYEYDSFKRKTLELDPLQRVTLWSYALAPGGCGSCSSSANPTLVTMPSGRKIAMTYDAADRKTSQTDGYDTAAAATTTYSYGVTGELESVTDPLNHITAYTYDARGRLLTATDPLNRTTTYTYDAAGNKLTEQRADGATTTYTYTPANRVATVKDAANKTTGFTYDGLGNMLALTDAMSRAHTFTYDGAGRRKTFQYPDSSQEGYGYDAAGNMVSYTNRAGAVRTATFNNRNRETAASWSDGTPGVTTAYDAVGRVISLQNTHATLGFAYDYAGQLLSESQAPAGGSAVTVCNTYTDDGQRQTLAVTGGGALTYSYTARGELAAISDGTNAVASFGYDAAGRRTNRVNANGTRAVTSYDAAGQLLSIQHLQGTNAIGAISYGYNSGGNRTNRVESGVADAYSYDAVDQITGVNYSTNRTVSYAYDALGNRSSVTDNNVATAYTANNLNQYTAVGGSALGYDAKGNLISGPGSASYTYDGNNRLTSATVGTNSATFAHDARMRNLKRVINGQTRFFYFDGWSLVQERDGAGNVVQNYVNGPRIDEIIRKTDSGGAVYYHSDALGSTVALTDGAGVAVERYSYDVFGTPTVRDGNGNVIPASAYANRFLFTGREWIKEVGLYDYRNRIYSPSLGRFLQTDPIKFAAGDVNLYKYVFNDPSNATDPYGLERLKKPPFWPQVPDSDNNPRLDYSILLNCSSMDGGNSECLTLCDYISSTGAGDLAATACWRKCMQNYADRCPCEK